MVIKPAQSEDAKAISDIIFNAAQELRDVDFDQEGWALLMESTSAERMQEIILSPEYLVFCCWKAEAILGFISLKNLDHLMQLFVLPQARRQGVAQLLWNHASITALKMGALGKFWVRSSSVAVPVYEKFGFVVDGGRQSFNGIRFQRMTLSVNNKK